MTMGTPREATLDREDCLRLLGSHQIARLVSGAAGTHLRPVNYILAAGDILTRADQPIDDGTAVTLEIDELDAVERQGWSVIVHGRAYAISEESVSADARERLAPWAPGPKASWTKIVIDEVSGRWVRAGRERDQLDARGYL